MSLPPGILNEQSPRASGGRACRTLSRATSANCGTSAAPAPVLPRSATTTRSIYSGTAQKCGLVIEEIDPKDDTWGKLYELYVRTDNYVATSAAKCIESKEGSFAVGAPNWD